MAISSAAREETFSFQGKSLSPSKPSALQPEIRNPSSTTRSREMAAETESAAAASGGIAGEMEVEAYRRLFPLAFLERHLSESVRPDARRLAEARPITVALGAVSSAHGSALIRLGDTVRHSRHTLSRPPVLFSGLPRHLFDEMLLQAMLTSIKLEVMSPPAESDEGSVGSFDP
jgi:exosome complex component RRP43